MIFKAILLSVFVSAFVTNYDADVETLVSSQYKKAMEWKVNATGEEVMLNRTEKRKLNIFLSNFAECLIEHFDNEDYDDRELISFAVSHNYKNNWTLFEYPDVDNVVKINKKHVERTVGKYFGIHEILHQSVNEKLLYEDGFYEIPIADGEMFVFCQVKKVIDRGGGVYDVFADLYREEAVFGDIYDSMEFWKDGDMKNVRFYNEITARVKKVEYDGLERYILLKYHAKEY